MSALLASIGGWLQRRMPTRESLEANRAIRPFAHRVLRAELWRFSRRSVPRGVALGLFVGVTIPFAHSFIAAGLAVFVGANVPVAFATTWAISNPLTLGFLLWLGWKIGKFLLRVDAFTGIDPFASLPRGQHGDAAAHHHHMLHNLAHAGLIEACGLAVEGVVFALLGYMISTWVWRWRVTRKWRARHRAPSQATA